MRFKYFLRGLGTGIVFTAIICLVTFQSSGARDISDKEVIERAKVLGMIEKEESVKDMFGTNDSNGESKGNTKEQETNQKPDKESTEKQTTADKTTQEKTEEESTTKEKNTEGVTTEKNATEEKTTQEKKEETTEENGVGKQVTITIRGGSTSFPVCQELQQLGVIKDATDFDNYLIKNGYANRIRVGTHTLKIGMSYEEIAIAISDPQ